MNTRNAWRNIFLLILLLSVCFILSSILSSAYLWYVKGELIASIDQLGTVLSSAQLRTFIGINQFVSFLLPGLLGLYVIKLRPESFQSIQSWWLFPFIIASYFVSLPFFQYLFYINLELPVPAWWPFQVEAIPPFLLDLIKNMSVLDLISNLVVIAVLPAIGEELIFRVLGIRLTEKLLKSSHLAILITAFCFAIVHFDFQGLLPRFFLGIILGYSFVLSRNMWVPITIHLIHNGSQLFIAYFSPSAVEDLNQNIEAPTPFWILTSIIVLFGGYYLIRKYSTIG